MESSVDLSHNPKGFLMAIAGRIWQDEKKKFARRNRIAPSVYNTEVDEISDKVGAAELIELHEMKREIREIISKLPEVYRLPVLFCYIIWLN
jgi:RNA polymerase sigma-70 factor (ECF subfamily)